jgi:hypothetical protein
MKLSLEWEGKSHAQKGTRALLSFPTLSATATTATRGRLKLEGKSHAKKGRRALLSFPTLSATATAPATRWLAQKGRSLLVSFPTLSATALCHLQLPLQQQLQL